MTSKLWAQAHEAYSKAGDKLFEPWFDCFAPGGRARGPGKWSACPATPRPARAGAHGLRELLPRRSSRAHRRLGARDGRLAARRRPRGLPAEWVQPISVPYRGYTVHELPPNGHGLVPLLALGILSGLDMGVRDAEAIHVQLEAMSWPLPTACAT